MAETETKGTRPLVRKAKSRENLVVSHQVVYFLYHFLEGWQSLITK